MQAIQIQIVYFYSTNLATTGYQQSLYIQQLISTSEITTYSIMVYHLNWCHHTTQSYYPDTEPTSPCPILIVPSAWLGSDKYQF